MKDEVSENYLLRELCRTPSFILSASSFPIVPLAVPFWNGATYRAILRTIVSGAVIDGRDLGALKSALLDQIGMADAVLCGSGRLALELALRACGVGNNDEVIIPSFCCSAVVAPILALGALPVLADVGAELNLTVETVDAAITGKTKAIVVPHLFGNPADISAIVQLAREKNIRVVDDAAQALGATVDGRTVGSFGDAGIISFGNEKVCFGLGGGAVVSNQPGLVDAENLRPAQLAPIFEKLAAAQFHWRWRRWTLPVQPVLSWGKRAAPDAPPAPYEKTAMANLQASVALSLMQTLGENIASRRARVRGYQELLGGEDRLELIPHGSGSGCLTQVVRVLPESRGVDLASKLVEILGKWGYEVQGSYVPIHLISGFEKCVWDRLPYAASVWAHLIELPCEPTVSLSHVEQISTLVKKLVRAHAA